LHTERGGKEDSLATVQGCPFVSAVTLSIALDYRPALLSRAGIGRVTRELARALAGRDDLDLHLFGHSLAAARVDSATPARARLHRLPIPGRSLDLLARLGLGAERLAGGAQVFHWTDYVQPPVGNATPVLTVHDLAFVREASWHGADAPVLEQRTRDAIARSQAVITPSETTANDVRRFAPHATVHVVAFGADHVPDHSGTEHPFDETPYALCLGTIEPRKNHHALLAAWQRLPEPRPRLVVVGGIGWECDDIVTALETAQRGGGVTWLRDCDDDRMWRLLHHADVLVYPSLWEGFGLPPLEAMQCGVPVVANDTPALAELTAGSAVLVDATKPDDLAQGITTAIDDAERLRAAGRRRAATFTWANCAEQHAAIYRGVAP